MLLTLAFCLVLGWAVIVTGPAFENRLRRKQLAWDYPAARVVFLLPKYLESGEDPASSRPAGD